MKTKALAFGSLYHASSFTKERVAKSNTLDAPTASKLPRHKSLHHRRSDSYTETNKGISKFSDTTMKPRSLDDTSVTHVSTIPTISFHSRSSSSLESVEADYDIRAGLQATSSPELSGKSSPDVEMRVALKPVQPANGYDVCDETGPKAMLEEGDDTLTNSMIVPCSSDSDVDDVDHPTFTDDTSAHKLPVRLVRSRLVSGSKPHISIRVEADCHDGTYVDY